MLSQRVGSVGVSVRRMGLEESESGIFENTKDVKEQLLTVDSCILCGVVSVLFIWIRIFENEGTVTVSS